MVQGLLLILQGFILLCIKGGIKMNINSNTILYFTGTGNSISVAKELKRSIGEVDLLSISSLAKEDRIKVDSQILGLVFPVYFARLPLMVEDLIKKLNINESTYVFAIATHGGGPAEVLKKLEKVLHDSGNNLNASFLLNMPANNIFAYNGPSMQKQKRILDKSAHKVKDIAVDIKCRVNKNPERSRIIIDTFIDRATIKLTDKIMKELHTKDEKFTVNETCNSCKICSLVCPASNIEIIDNRPVWKHKCEQCTACVQFCPNKSINLDGKTENRRRYKHPDIKLDEMISR